jgi:hypothetical protein
MVGEGRRSGEGSGGGFASGVGARGGFGEKCSDWYAKCGVRCQVCASGVTFA